MREHFIVVHFQLFMSLLFDCRPLLFGASLPDPTGALPLVPAGGLPSPRSPHLYFIVEPWIRPWLERQLYRISFILSVGLR